MKAESTGMDDRFGIDLTSVTMGIDALERRQSRESGLLDTEGLVPIFLGDDLVEPRRYDDWWQVEDDLNRLSEQVRDLASEHRRVFAAEMIVSLRTAVLLFAGASPSFEKKVRDLVGAPTGAVGAGTVEGLRDSLDGLLRRRGITRGDLPQRIGEWEQTGRLEPQQLDGVFRTLMDQARERTARLIFDCGDFDMELNPIRDAPYSARCSFAERKMDLNVDHHFTRAEMKHLVAHEVFPGHATQLLYTRARLDEGRAFHEVLLCTANSILGCVQEGIGDESVELLDWIEDDDDAIQADLRRLRSAAQTTAAWYLMHDGWQADAVADYLRQTAAGQDAWIAGRLRMAAHPFRGPFIASYWGGAVAVRNVRERTPAEARAEFVEYLYANAHSPRSLDLFQPTATAR